MLARSLPIFQMGQLSCMQHQVHDAVEDSMPAGDSPCVLFSAHKMLKQKKLANVPSLWGIALSWEGDFTRSSNNTDPHRFQNCGAYANLYCKILLCSGQWQCVICRKLNGSEGEYIAPSKEDLLKICQNCHHLWLITFKLETRDLVLFQLLILRDGALEVKFQTVLVFCHWDIHPSLVICTSKHTLDKQIEVSLNEWKSESE